MKVCIDSFATLISEYAEELLAGAMPIRTEADRAAFFTTVWQTIAKQHPDLQERWVHENC